MEAENNAAVTSVNPSVTPVAFNLENGTAMTAGEESMDTKTSTKAESTSMKIDKLNESMFGRQKHTLAIFQQKIKKKTNETQKISKSLKKRNKAEKKGFSDKLATKASKKMARRNLRNKVKHS